MFKIGDKVLVNRKCVFVCETIGAILDYNPYCGLYTVNIMGKLRDYFAKDLKKI